MSEPRSPGELPEKASRDPGDGSLRRQIITYERTANPRELRRMRRDETLDEYVAIKIRATRNDAHYRLSIGTMPSEAWRLAIRRHILEREDD